MSWKYLIASGEVFSPDGVYVGRGYSGQGIGLNNVDAVSQRNVGPIPPGTYIIGAAFTHHVCGPISMRLTPTADDEMFGRDGFLIHGDNILLNHTASDGCIILEHRIRMLIAASFDKELLVQ